MKVAIIHDWLNTKFGGAESVLQQLSEIYPEAPIFTLIAEPETVEGHINPSRIKTSYLQRMPEWLKQRSRYLLPLIPAAIEQFDLSEYDVVISSSNAFAKSVITRPETLHICYCHTPMRFVWDYWPRYVDEQHVGKIRGAAIHLLTSRMRLWDYYSAARVDKWLANSETTATRIKKYYRAEVDQIIYPGAILNDFARASKPSQQEYFVTLSSLTPYKKIDMAIEACNALGKKLIVIGDGIDRSRLEALAGDTVSFAGRVTDPQRAELIAGAQALIFPNEEDFGIAPVEAMASGTPVIAYGKGGLTETVVDGVTGKFFFEPSVAALTRAIQGFSTSDYEKSDLTARAKKFSDKVFKQKIIEYVEKAYKQHV